MLTTAGKLRNGTVVVERPIELQLPYCAAASNCQPALLGRLHGYL